MIALIDYGAGNLASVRKAFAALGVEVRVARAPADVQHASAIVVPGVGHFGATAALGDDWRRAVRARLDAGRPLLGICLGMQWLFEGSAEAPDAPGLGVLPGVCRPLTGPVKVPHVGWNGLHRTRPSWILDAVDEGAHAYFTHGYAAPDTQATVAVTTHGECFASVVETDLIAGVQCHPEKSGDVGLQVLRNFLARVAGRLPERRDRVRTASVPSRESTLSKRLIACLDVRDGRVVKGVNFEGLRDAGDPGALARRYNVEGIDEVVILDVTATLESRRALASTVRAVAAELFIPLAVGGGIRSEADAAAAIEAGADKVGLNTAPLEQPALLTTLAARYGSQAVVVAVDARREGDRFAVYARSGRAPAARDAVEWAREAADRGAGEILLTSIDRDGTKQGFDCELTAAVSAAVPIPVIASGGAGTFEHFVEVFTDGRADAALAASIFHYSEKGVRDLKQHLARAGVPVRMTP